MKYCYYGFQGEVKIYTEALKEVIESDAAKRNVQVEWEEGIYVPVEVIECKDYL